MERHTLSLYRPSFMHRVFWQFFFWCTFGATYVQAANLRLAFQFLKQFRNLGGGCTVGAVGWGDFLPFYPSSCDFARNIPRCVPSDILIDIIITFLGHRQTR